LTQTALSGPLVLPADVLLVPVADLSQAARLQLNCQDGDVAITRPRLRTPSRLVSAGAAELLREFAFENARESVHGTQRRPQIVRDGK